jgi:YggT family protein
VKLLICLALQAFVILVFVRIILSWFPASEGLFMTVQRFTFTTTEWVMGPLRRVIPPVRLGAAALDLSPMIVLLGVWVLRILLRC